MSEATAVVYVRRRDAKAAKIGLERASLLDRRFRMAPAASDVGDGDVCGDGDGASATCIGPSSGGSAADGPAGGAPSSLKDCIAIPVLPGSIEVLRGHFRDRGNCNSATSAYGDDREPSKLSEAGDCGSLDGEDFSWLDSLEVVGFGRQVCPFSTSVLGNNNKRIRSRPTAAAGEMNGDCANGRTGPLSTVQCALIETLTAWLEDNNKAARANGEEFASHEHDKTIEAMVRVLSVRTCPKKLEVIGDDRTLVVPRYALFVSSRQTRCKDDADGGAKNNGGDGGNAKKGDEFRELLDEVICRSSRNIGCEASSDASAVNEIQSLLWENLAKDHNSPRVVRRGDIDPDSGVRESGHRILWTVPSPSDTTDGDCNRGFLPARTGPDSPGWITVTEHGIRQSFDLCRVMFSRGNVTEKKRFGALVQPGERVLDMYAGIGYYTLPALVHGKASHATACEWNPHALEALRHNLRANGVEDRATVLEGDCRVSLKEHTEQSGRGGGIDWTAENNQFDRISLGLLPSSEGGWAAAISCLDQRTGGWLHVHGNVPTPERMDWAHWLVRSLTRIAENTDAKDWIAVCTHVERVKSFAPKVDHLVADVFVGPRDSPAILEMKVESLSTGVVDASGKFGLTPLHATPPSCALDEGGILHQSWLRDGS